MRGIWAKTGPILFRSATVSGSKTCRVRRRCLAALSYHKVPLSWPWFWQTQPRPIGPRRVARLPRPQRNGHEHLQPKYTMFEREIHHCQFELLSDHRGASSASRNSVSQTNVPLLETSWVVRRGKRMFSRSPVYSLYLPTSLNVSVCSVGKKPVGLSYS